MQRLLPLLLLLCSCANEPDLTGHWHAETRHTASDETPSGSKITFDILNDTLLSVWNNLPYWAGQPGYHNQKARTFHFGVECISTAWGYTIESANKLRAFDLHSDHSKQITLTRHTDCTIESHLFLDSRLNIHLPEAMLGSAELTNLALLRDYTIGPANIDYKEFYPGPYHYQLGDKIITKRDTGFFELYEWQHLIKLPEAKRLQAKSIIYANAKSNSFALNDLLEYSYNKGDDTLYFAMLKRGRDTTLLRYLPVPVLSSAADESLNVEEWLNLEASKH